MRQENDGDFACAWVEDAIDIHENCLDLQQRLHHNLQNPRNSGLCWTTDRVLGFGEVKEVIVLTW